MNILDNLEIVNAIKSDVIKRRPIEACGLIIENNGYYAIPCENTAQNPKDEFLIDRKEIKDKVGNGKIIGYYHSHESNGDLGASRPDMAVMAKIGLKSIIVDINTLEMKEWDKIDNFIPAFENRPFVAGYLDCSELVKDYYKKNFNIDIKSCDHPIKHMSWEEIKIKWNELQDFNKEDYLFFKNYFIENGFIEIDKKDLRQHDVILCRAKEISAPIHALVYIKKDFILHHPSGRYSLMEHYTNFYKKLSVFYLRHKDLA